MSTNESKIKEEVTKCDNKDNESLKQETSEITNIKQELTNNNTTPNNNNNIDIKTEENTLYIQNHDHYPGPAECIVYWDYYNNPIPSTHNFKNIIPTLKQNICNKIGSKPIQFRIYSVSNNLRETLQDTFDINGIKEINVSHHTSITKRLLIDISLKLHESEKNKVSNCIGVISENTDISYLLSRIHKEQPISNSFVISFDSNTIHPSTNYVDFVLTIGNVSRKQYNNAVIRPIQTDREYKEHKTKIKTINITLEKLGSNNDTMKLNVCLIQNIKSIKNKIKEKFKVQRRSSIVIRFKGKNLTNKTKIRSAGVYDGDTIYWTISELCEYNSKRKKSSSSGEKRPFTMPLRVPDWHRSYINMVKARNDSACAPKCKKRKSDHTLIEIIVLNVNTKQRVKYNVYRDDKISDLRLKMAETIPMLKDMENNHRFVLFKKTRNLNSRKSIDCFNIHNGSILKWKINWRPHERNNITHETDHESEYVKNVKQEITDNKTPKLETEYVFCCP